MQVTQPNEFYKGLPKEDVFFVKDDQNNPAAGDFVNDNTLTVYIKRLREKIETDPADPQIIRTVRGIGYMVDA